MHIMHVMYAIYAVSLVVRVREYYKRVVPVLLHSCCNLLWMSSTAKALRVWENWIWRRMADFRRQPNETFAGFISRATSLSHKAMIWHGFESVVTLVLREIFSLGSSVSQPPDTLPLAAIILQSVVRTRILLWWRKCQQLDELDRGVDCEWRRSSVGRPRSLWESIFAKIFGAAWMDLLTQRASERTSQFRDAACKRVSIKILENAYRRKPKPLAASCDIADGCAKAPRQLQPLILHWAPERSTSRLLICGDSELVINWILGQYRSRQAQNRRLIGILHNALGELVASGVAAPAQPHGDFCHHIFRERNKLADALANGGHGKAIEQHTFQTVEMPCQVLMCFDGSFNDGSASIGFWIGAQAMDTATTASVLPDCWRRLVHGYGSVDAVSALECELLAATVATIVTIDVLRGRPVGSSFDNELGTSQSVNSIFRSIHFLH